MSDKVLNGVPRELLERLYEAFGRGDGMHTDDLRAVRALLAQPAAPRCTFPSGDGSLEWPCPAHPAPADGEAVEVVAYMKRLAGAECRADGRCYDVIFVPVDGYDPLMTVAQHQRIVAQLGQQVEPDAFQIARHSKRLVEQQRERIALLEAELSALKAHQVWQEPAGEVHFRTGGGISLLHVELAQPLPPGTKLYNTPQPAPAQDVAKTLRDLVESGERLAPWLAASLDDKKACEELKEAARGWLYTQTAAHDKQSGGEV